MISLFKKLQHRLFGPLPADPDDPMPYLRARPPECLAGFVATPIDRAMDNLDGHGSRWNTFFEIRCACGSSDHLVLGYYVINWRNKEVFVGPLALECGSCNKVTELLDTAINGYNGKLCGGGTTLRGSGPRAKFKCGTCGVQPFATIVRFEYGAEGVYDDDDFFRRDAQDVFDWFTLLGRCENCQRKLRVTDFECA